MASSGGKATVEDVRAAIGALRLPDEDDARLVAQRRDLDAPHHAKFVVIGAPGHGKSTVLNEFAGANLFDVSGAGESCTQIGDEWEAKNNQTISIPDGKHTHRLELVDTPGFPDTNPDKALGYYDHVIAKCNEEINGVLFVVKPERQCADVMERHQTLLKQFVHLRPPLIILVNGTENPRPRDPPNKRTNAVKDFRAFGREIESVSGLQARELLVSYCLDEVQDLGKEVARVFALTKPQTSSIPTLAAIQAKLEACKNREEHIRQRMGEADAKIEKCKKDIAGLENDMWHLRAWALGTCWVPLAGQVTALTLVAILRSKAARVEEQRAEIEKAKQAKSEAGDPEQLAQEAEKYRDQVEHLNKFLKPK